MANGNGHANAHGAANGYHGANRIGVARPVSLGPLLADEFEVSVLAAMVLHEEYVPGVLAVVQPEHFYRNEHQILARAIVRLHDRGSAIDPLLILDELQSRGDFQKMGGDEVYSKILGSIAHPHHAIEHAHKVREKADSRAIVDACTGSIDDVLSGRLEINDNKEHTLDRIASIAVHHECAAYGKADIETMSDVQPMPVSWLWENRITSGEVNLVVGDSGVGKGMLSMGLAATVTTGGRWPDPPHHRAEPGRVLLLSREERSAVTIRPRLDAAGADTSLVHRLTGVTLRNGRKRSFDLVEDIRILRDACDLFPGVRLIIIDPIFGYLGGADRNSSGEVRDRLQPLIEFGDKTLISILLIHHPNKSGSASATQRAGGAAAFIEVARQVWFLFQDLDQRDRRLFLHHKNSHGEKTGGLAFRIRDNAIQWETQPIDMHADDYCQEDARRHRGAGGAEDPKIKLAQDCLLEHLKDGQAHELEDIVRAGETAGFVRSTIYNARKKLIDRDQISEWRVGRKSYLKLRAMLPDFGEPPADPKPF